MLPMLSFSYCQFAIALRAFAMFFILVVLLPRVVAQDPQATAQDPPLSKLEPLKFCSLGGPFVHIPSASAGAEGLLVRVSPPALARYSKGAPIAVHMFASRPSVSESFMCLNQQGFVDVGFLCPGGEYRHPDGTVWKSGGRNSGTPYADAQACVEPLADVLSFATGKTRSLDGKSIQDYVGAVRAMTDNAGVVGYSYGGNLAILAMARHGERFPGLKWYASWESPILGPVDWFGVTFQPNPFYDPTTGKIDFDRLRYSPEMPLWVWPVQGHPRPEWPHGGLYLDGDRNGRLNKDADYGFWVDVVPGPPLKAFYPLDVTREALGRKVFGDKWPAHIATLQEVEERDSHDDALRHITAAVKKLPGLTVLIFEHQINHGGQGRTGVAADHPHAIAQVNAWLDAHARWVRFNPDEHYVEAILGRKPSHDVQFPAGRRLDRDLIRNSLEPEADDGGPTDNQGMAAVACELADRTYLKNWAPVLNRVLVQQKRKAP
jgi:hypothetical protein